MQRYFVKDKKDNYFLLEDSDVHHIKNVMRNKIGDMIECVYQENVYHCEIEDVFSGRVKIVKEIDEVRELGVDITIAIALVKEQKMDLILQKLTELGVNRILPLKMERSIIQLDEVKFQKKRERWLKICKEAAEQSKRTKVPEIMDLCSIKQLKNFSFEQKYICSVRNQENLVNNYLQPNIDCAKIIFVIGPEGGISLQEEQQLEELGYTPVSLGSRVMRVETAAIYVASIINFCSMR